MQVCSECKKEVLYIATSGGVTVKVDDIVKTIFTANGRKVEGYEIHKCEVEKNAKEEKSGS